MRSAVEMISPATWSSALALTVFVASAVVIVVVGTRLTGTLDELADRTGLGEALVGAVLLGASTSLAGSVLSVAAAMHGRPELALGNAVGGIPAQTAFLALADFAYARGNLEHASASVANILQAAVLVCLLALLLVSPDLPNVTLLGVHPITPTLLAAYAGGIVLIDRARETPMWRPALTRLTRLDRPQRGGSRHSLSTLWLTFGVEVTALGVAGWFMEGTAGNLIERTGLTQTTVGLLLTSTITSLPELVTAIAAVRRGAVTLAVGGILGGNVFDTLFAAFSDVAYRQGSIYHAMSASLQLWLAVSVLMTGVLLLGLLVRQQAGPLRVGFESLIILGLYVGLVVLLLAG